jgi:hypothetical protein
MDDLDLKRLENNPKYTILYYLLNPIYEYDDDYKYNMSTVIQCYNENNEIVTIDNTTFINDNKEDLKDKAKNFLLGIFNNESEINDFINTIEMKPNNVFYTKKENLGGARRKSSRKNHKKKRRHRLKSVRRNRRRR